MHYAVALVILKHESKPPQKVKVTHPTKEASAQIPQLKQHVQYILGMQGDPLTTPYEIVELIAKEI